MTTEYWAIGWADQLWTNAPSAALEGADAKPITLGHWARVAQSLEADTWDVLTPDRSPVVLSVWITVLGLEAGVWDDPAAAAVELAATPLSTLQSCYAALSGE